jgi:hypothetical protein
MTRRHYPQNCDETTTNIVAYPREIESPVSREISKRNDTGISSGANACSAFHRRSEIPTWPA